MRLFKDVMLMTTCLAVFSVAWSVHAGNFFEDAGNAVGKAANDVGKTIEKGAQDTGKTVEKGAQDAGKTVEKAVQDTGNAIEKGAQDTGKTAEKAAQDTGKTIEKAVQDTGKAGETVYKFGVREMEALGERAKDANQRISEGKFVDAVWHFSADQLKDSNDNLAKAAKESDIVRVAGQIAASAYGGPGGAAAYAAWLAYNETKDLGLALRVGLITGAAAYASGGVSDLPNTDAAAIAEKTIMAGAIGGAAVAVAGGDQQAIQEGFLKSGGAVLVQSIYETQTTHELDARISKGEAYCMAATDPTAACAPPIEAYELDASGKPVVGDDSLPKVDVRKTDPMRPHVGQWAKPGESSIAQEPSLFMVSVSKYPGMNAMALLHDHVSYAMKFDPVTNVWTIVPATVVTYYGTNVPTDDQIRKSAEGEAQK
ncbi:hypothetical protein [Rhizobium leguminosarum]|uniref:hypothetical protein n=1 Tax=Rhizobium leguminosarum TaxID=384 RepID=UPI0013B6964B|nr:hypothetical protein [Rhizobium leguminosarum]NEI65025.1 hypothetical protein [Rhizobium leguminosarum]